MKKKIFYTIKNIIIVTILIVMYFFIGIKIENNKAFAATTPTSISIYDFGKKTYSTLTNGNHASVSMINNKYTFTSTGADDTARQSSSRNFCVHWTSVYNYWDKEKDQGEFVLSKIIDIRKTNGDYRVASNISNGKTYTSKLNNILAYISYYGTKDPTGHEADGIEDDGSDTLWGFRYLYAFTGWRQGVYDNLSIKTYRNNPSYNPGSANNVYTDGKTYADFIEANVSNSREKMKKVTLTDNPTIDSTYIGPFKVNFPTGGTGTGKEHIDNKVWCTYIDDSDSETTYSGNFYSKSGGSYTSLGNAVPRNQKFYIKVSGVDVKKVRFYNSFYLYLARVFLFDGGYSQTNISVTGQQHLNETHVEYIIENDPDVEISKEVSFQPQTSYGSSLNVERGDTVYFKITITNSGASTIINLADTLQSGLSVEAISLTGASGSWTTTSSWSGLTNLTVNKDSTIVRYLKCKVANNASGTISNTITATPVSPYKLDASGTASKTATASVTVLGYSYSLNKTVSKALVEPGDIINYTITLTNNNDTKLHDMVIEDTIPAGLEYIAGTAASDCTNWDIDDSSTTLKFTRKSVGMGKGSCVFEIQCKVSDSLVYRTSTSPITNTAKLTTIKNKHGIDLATKEASVDINLATYDYNISKVVNAIYKPDGTATGSITEAEPGDTIEYKITVNNKGTGTIYASITDLIKTSITDKVLLDNDSNTVSYTNYEVAGGTPGEIFVKTKVISKITDAKYTVENSATLTAATNANGVNVMKTTGNESSVTVTVLGYDATLNKYITKHNGNNISGRNAKTNAERNDSPIVVKKGDTLTYTIVFKNTGSDAVTGNTTFYKPQINDALPNGIECETYSSGWSKTGNVFKYNGNIGIGETKTLEINCKVTMSNMQLLNLENIASYSRINNRNSVDTKSVLDTEENKDYVRLDELLIAGKVWNDANKNGIIDSGEGAMSDVEVILHDVATGPIKTVTTGSDGKYEFANIQKATEKDTTTGNYSATSQYKQYYIEFKYNGVTHQSTPGYKNKANLSGNGNYNGDYPKDSNASEITQERTNFNNSLETISYNKATATSNGGAEIALEYEKDEHTSRLIKIDGVDINRTMSSYSFVDPGTGNIDYLWLYKTISNAGTSGYVPETEYLKYINLGLYRREQETDLELTSSIYSQTKTINGQRQIAYRPEEYTSTGTDRIENHNSNLYWTDYYYDIDRVYSDVDWENDGTIDLDLSEVRDYKRENSSVPTQQSDPETNYEYTYRTKITNESTVDSVIREVAQYYDENFETAYEDVGGTITPFGKTLKIDRDDDGRFNDDYQYESKVEYRVVKYDANGNDTLGSTKRDDATIKLENQYPDYIDNDANLMDGYEVLYIEFPDNVVLKPGETLEIYTTYMLKKDANRKLYLGKHEVISEISAYSSYFPNTKDPSGTVDIDSNPGNLGLNEYGTDKEVIYNRDCYEDDTRRSNVDLGLTSSTSGRKIKGTVWYDGKTGELTADGIYDASEPGIAGVEVQLYEIIKVGDAYYEVPAMKVVDDGSGNPRYDYVTYTTGANGNYELEGFFPGLYIVRFNYGHNPTGDLTYNGQDYKSTIYSFSDTYNFEVSNNNRHAIGPSTVQELPFKSTTTNAVDLNTYNTMKDSETPRRSDARDDEKRRLEVMEYSIEMKNRIAETLKGESVTDAGIRETFVDETKMFADTATFIAKNENISHIKTGGDDYADVLICLGQIEDNTSYWFESNMVDAERDLRFVLEKGALHHSATNGYWRAWAENDSVTEGTETIPTTTYLRNYEIKNIDFGLVLRPENRIELKKYIKQITLESSAGDKIVDLYYDIYNPDSTLKVDGDGILQPELNETMSKGFENVQSLNNTSALQGFRYLNVDEELLQGAKIGIKYGFIAINNSDIDYISSNLYGNALTIQSMTTEAITTSIRNAITDISALNANGIERKYEDDRYYTWYVGSWYHTGNVDTDGIDGVVDVLATIKIDNILDYVDNNLVFNPTDNNGKWMSAKQADLLDDGYLNEDVNIFIDKDGNERDIIADINGVGFQIGEKSNLAVTIDNESSPMFKHLLPTDDLATADDIENRAETELFVSTVLSAENESDDMVYENIAEIIKFTTLTGRRTISEADITNRGLTEMAQTVGNAKVNMVGYIDSDPAGTLGEPDTSITEKVMLTPPTGGEMIDSYGITKVIIYVTASIGAIVLGILFIPKLVTKIKNRKFVK